MLNERGGIEGDLVALRLAQEDYRLYVGTAAIRRGLAWLKRHLRAGDAVTFADETEAHAVLALAGPEAARVAEAVGAGALNALGYFRHREVRIAGVAVRGVRLSCVGEAGWEITCRSDRAATVYEALHGAGARACGVCPLWQWFFEKASVVMDAGVSVWSLSGSPSVREQTRQTNRGRGGAISGRRA